MGARVCVNLLKQLNQICHNSCVKNHYLVKLMISHYLSLRSAYLSTDHGEVVRIITTISFKPSTELQSLQSFQVSRIFLVIFLLSGGSSDFHIAFHSWWLSLQRSRNQCWDSACCWLCLAHVCIPGLGKNFKMCLGNTWTCFDTDIS